MTLRRQPSIRRLLALFSFVAALIIVISILPVAAIDWERICDSQEREIVSGYQYARALIKERLAAARQLAEQIALQPEFAASPSVTILLLDSDGSLLSSSSGRTVPRLARLLPDLRVPRSGVEIDDQGNLVAVGVAPRADQWVAVVLPFGSDDARAIREASGLESSFFAGRVRVVTTLTNAQGEPVVGTSMSAADWSVLAGRAGHLHWSHDTPLPAGPYLQVKMPLHGLDDTVVGAVAVGRSWGEYWARLLRHAWVWLAIAGACILLIVLLNLTLQRRLRQLVKRLQQDPDAPQGESAGPDDLDGLFQLIRQLRAEKAALVRKNERLSEQLVQAQTLATLGQLAAGVAHDLNNPLTTIIGLADIIKTSGLDEDTQHDLEVIRRQAERSGRIVRGLLTFARRQSAEPQWVSLNELVSQTLELLAYQARVSNIRCESCMEEDLPLTWADPSQMQQVLFNLMNNAMQAMSAAHGNGTLRVETCWSPPSAGAPHGRIAIRIIDDGPGLPDDVLPRLFQPYFTTKEPGAGTGLGLAISNSVIRRHSGHIRAENNVTAGATFCIELPVTPEPPQDVQPSTSAPSTRHARNILLADSDPRRVSQLARVLRRQGHFISTAGDGLLARSKMEMETYDLVLCGLQLSRLGGQELYDWTREQRPEMAGRFVFIAGDELSAEDKTFLRTIRALVLWPPFQEDRINAIVSQLLDPDNGQSRVTAPRREPASGGAIS